jgi:hypothetical protein
MVEFVITYVTYDGIVMRAFVEHNVGVTKEEVRNHFFSKNADNCSYVIDVKYDC